MKHNIVFSFYVMNEWNECNIVENKRRRAAWKTLCHQKYWTRHTQTHAFKQPFATKEPWSEEQKTAIILSLYLISLFKQTTWENIYTYKYFLQWNKNAFFGFWSFNNHPTWETNNVYTFWNINYYITIIYSTHNKIFNLEFDFFFLFFFLILFFSNFMLFWLQKKINYYLKQATRLQREIIYLISTCFFHFELF